MRNQELVSSGYADLQNKLAHVFGEEATSHFRRNIPVGEITLVDPPRYLDHVKEEPHAITTIGFLTASARRKEAKRLPTPALLKVLDLLKRPPG